MSDLETAAANRVGVQALTLGYGPGMQLNLTLPPLVIAAVDETAAREGHDRADMLRLLIADGLLVHRHVLDHQGGTA